MRLLIIDDNEQVRLLLKSLLSDIAEEIFERDDGRQALEAYTEHNADWVLMDIKMKHTDGLAAAAQIHASFPGAKIIILTQYDDQELRDAAIAAGASHYVVKENLLELRRILASRVGN